METQNTGARKRKEEKTKKERSRGKGEKCRCDTRVVEQEHRGDPGSSDQRRPLYFKNGSEGKILTHYGLPAAHIFQFGPNRSVLGAGNQVVAARSSKSFFSFWTYRGLGPHRGCGALEKVGKAQREAKGPC